jgi:hypothetical protein
MSEDKPVACSLGAVELEQRIAKIAGVGAQSLIDREVDGDRHLLRFHAGADTRGRLEEIVAAEAECCSFLDLALAEEGGELVLSIAAPGEARVVAEALAAAFGGARA